VIVPKTRALAALVGLVVGSVPLASFAEGCWTVSGRMMLSNGTPSVRIAVRDAHKMLGVVQQDESFNQLPANVRRAWAARGKEAIWANGLVGEFKVCQASPARPGQMQSVQVLAGSHLRLESGR